MAKVELFLQNCSETVGEAPHWDDRTGQLLYVDIFDNSVHRWTEGSGIVESYKFGNLILLYIYFLQREILVLNEIKCNRPLQAKYNRTVRNATYISQFKWFNVIL